MKKKKGLLLFTLLLVFLNLSPLPAQEEKQVRQQEFVVHLVMALKLESLLPNNPQIQDYVRLLEARGITIPGGYKPDELITTKQMAIMLIPAMGLNKENYDKLKDKISFSYKNKAVIINIVGDVKIRLKDSMEWKDAKPGVSLDIKDIIKTGVQSSAIIRLGQISIAKVKENTTVAIYQLAKNPIIYIEEGDMLLDTSTKRHAINYFIITPTTVAAVRGTIIKTTYKDGVTTVLLVEGKTEVYNVSKYSLDEKIAMAKKDKFLISPIEVFEGYYVREDKIYPLTDKEKESIYAEAEQIKIDAETNLSGAAAEELLKEKGIKNEDYLKIDIIDKGTDREVVAKTEKND